MTWAKETLYGLDFETTGVDPTECRPVTVSLVEVDGEGALVRARGAIVNTGVEIPEEASAIHGISTERARAEGRQPDDVFPKVLTLLNGAAKDKAPLVMFNARFDWTLLHAEAERLGLEVPELNIIDPFIIDKHVDKWRKGRRTLGATCEHYGVELLDAHNSTVDAYGAVGVARAIARDYSKIADLTPAELMSKQKLWFIAWKDSFNQYLAKKSDNPDLVTGGWPR